MVKTVLITGATSGIGKATARELSATGRYRLILTGRRTERLEELKDELTRSGNTDVHVFAFDIRDLSACKAFWDNLPDGLRQVDVLINNAGLAKGLNEIHEGSFEHWEQMIDTNIKGLLYMTRLISPGMVERRQGHIINLGSTAGKETYPNGNVYCATKFAVNALTKAMRVELYDKNIRVTTVDPGMVETEFSLVRFDGDEERAKNVYKGMTPLSPADIADTIIFCATRPAHVNISEVVIYPSDQANTTTVKRS